MSTYDTPYSPMHIDCTIGQPYGNPSTSYTCGFHTGVDFPETGTGTTNPDLYSITNDGVVVYTYKNSTGTTPALGNQVMIFDRRTNLYYRYCHMVYGSINLNVGDTVNLNTYIGKMGNTGNSTGTHLHLEASRTETWSCENFVDPCEPLGFPNVRGTVVHYTGEEPPPPPPPPRPSNNNTKKWLFSRIFKANIRY